MCGILGVVAKQRSSLSLRRDQLIAMRETMVSRGPDDAGMFCFENRAMFAHRRLAIRDPDVGQQPWVCHQNRYILVYNGELYNTDQLNQKTASHFTNPVRTHCDTEVLMRAFQLWGAEAATQLRGMLACGFYDTKLNRLTLIRDRFGVKPLYYASVGNEFVFASSPAAILKHPQFSALPNWTAIHHYLATLRTTFDDQTMIQGIHQLPAGCYLQLDESGIQITKYWDYPQEKSDLNFQQSTDLFEELFADAVQSRMVSDVPVGMMLSGGVDSSLLGTYVKKHLENNFVAQCGVGLTDEISDDERYANEAAQLLECKFQTVSVAQQQYRDSWQHLIRTNALPLSTPSDVIIYHLAQSLKQQVGVVLGGEGADELLCGYPALHGLGRDFDLLKQIKQNSNLSTIQKNNFLDSVKKTYQNNFYPDLVNQYFSIASVVPFPVISILLKSKKCSDIEKEIVDHYRRLISQGSQNSDDSTSGLAGMTRLLHRVNLETLLTRLDQSTMAASLEARVPYTDHLLVEKIWQTDYAHRLRANPNCSSIYFTAQELEEQSQLQTKRILREVASRSLSKKLAYRKKASFPTPVFDWLQTSWKSWGDNLLQTSPFLQEYFQESTLEYILQNPQQTTMWKWTLLNLAIWGDAIWGDEIFD